MRYTLTLFMSIVSVVLPAMAAAQDSDAGTSPTDALSWADSARAEIEAAYIEADVDRLVEARVLIDRALTRHPDDALLLHYKGYALYREANLRQGMHGEDDVDRLLESALEPLERSNELDPMPETQALLASAIGQRIGSNPLRGMTMGPKADGWMDRAMESGADNPRVWLLRGVGAIFKPRLFGGGLDKAEADLRRAIELFEEDRPARASPAWGRGEAWVWLGQTTERQGNATEAREAYLKALDYEPGNRWVRDVLLPRLSAETWR